MGAFGSALHFAISDPAVHETMLSRQLFATRRVATIRLAPQLMKGLAYLLHRQVVQPEWRRIWQAYGARRRSCVA